MGLIKSYDAFLANPSVTSAAFSGDEAISLDDTVTFNRRVLDDVSKGLVEITQRSADTWYVYKRKEIKMKDALTATDDRSKAVQKTPWRVSLEAMKRKVDSVEYIHPVTLPHMTICVIVLDNGYALQGMSAPADPANFDERLGKDYAYEDAMRRLWSLEAYVMRDHMTGKATVNSPEDRWPA